MKIDELVEILMGKNDSRPTTNSEGIFKLSSADDDDLNLLFECIKAFRDIDKSKSAIATFTKNNLAVNGINNTILVNSKIGFELNIVLTEAQFKKCYLEKDSLKILKMIKKFSEQNENWREAQEEMREESRAEQLGAMKVKYDL